MADTTPGTGVPGPWYHGPPEALVVLPIGSTITQERALAAATSHKPSLLVQNDGYIRHNGQRPGFLSEADVAAGRQRLAGQQRAPERQAGG